MRALRFCATLLAVAISGCANLLYHPTDVMYFDRPELLEQVREEVSFASADGTRLLGWFFAARKCERRGAILQFHGNGQNMTAHFASLAWVIDQGYDLFVFDYRGYGLSDGKPEPAGVNADAVAAIRYLIGRERTQPCINNITLYGQSLGGAVLMRALEEIQGSDRKRIRAVVIESSFDDYHEIARDMLARNWLTFLIQPLAYVVVPDSYSPQESIPHITPIPLLVIHGDNDPVIPYRFADRIYERAGQPKRLISVPGGGHIDAMARENGKYRKLLMEFLSSCASR